MLPTASAGRITASGANPAAPSWLRSTGSEPSPPKPSRLASNTARNSRSRLTAVAPPPREGRRECQSGDDRRQQDQFRVAEQGAQPDVPRERQRPAPPVAGREGVPQQRERQCHG